MSHETPLPALSQGNKNVFSYVEGILLCRYPSGCHATHTLLRDISKNRYEGVKFAVRGKKFMTLRFPLVQLFQNLTNRTVMCVREPERKLIWLTDECLFLI